MILKSLNARMTFGPKLAVLAAVLIAPGVVLAVLFFRQSGQDIASAGQALQRARLMANLWTGLVVVALCILASIAVAWAIARDLAVHVRDLKAALMRVSAGDFTADIPHRSAPGEIGLIAGGVEAFRRASADNARLMSELDAALVAAQDYQSWLRLALETGRMAAWRRKLPDGPIEPSPELARLIGCPPGVDMTTEDFTAVIVDPDVVRRLEKDRAHAAAGEFDDQALEESVVPFRRLDTGEIRWAMLRQEVVVDPTRQNREIVFVAIDVTERKHLMDELNHRVKNNLATVLSLAMQTAKSTEDMRRFIKAFTGRVQVLSRINELLIRHSWGQVELKEVVMTALRPHLGERVQIVTSASPRTAVSARAAVSLSQVLHELAVNAVQHGALAGEGGRVEIAWSEPDPEHGALTWIERTPRPTTPPTRSGFGAMLIQRVTAGDLGGRAELDFRPDGLAATISFALQGATA